MLAVVPTSRPVVLQAANVNAQVGGLFYCLAANCLRFPKGNALALCALAPRVSRILVTVLRIKFSHKVVCWACAAFLKQVIVKETCLPLFLGIE